MEVKDFINKNKSLLQKIGIGVISLVIVIMICLSPNIIKKLKGNVSSIDASTIQSVKNEVFISRDRFGVKPFYYSYYNDTFLFGSEIKQLLCYFNRKWDVNKKRMLEYLIRKALT